jgi:hypothetical protein
MRILIAIALLATACSKKESSSSSGGSDCETAVARGVEQTIAKRRGSNAGEMTAADKEVPDKLEAVLVKTCTDDKWAKDVLDCFKTADDIKVCKEKLTPEQRGNYTRNVMQVMMGARQQGGMGHGGPTGGSMTGSGQEPAPAAPTGSGSN